MLVVAFAVLLYPTVSSYVNEKNGSKVVSNYDAESVRLSNAEKEKMTDQTELDAPTQEPQPSENE